ncbi:hypothetical protein [Marinobacter sp.]|uniref:hypothetical protein n=1 Tax=Marinobacter sp. TaxID=50741 RepID=UPI0019F83EF9|nr:hypothetical protein [Marinobacter sp.]MBE0485000.1 hypothetical protein [Marinobacter sp.]
MTSDDNDNHTPGTASPAKIRKAACGIRFDEDELQEGIDFSAAAELKPDDKPPGQEPTPAAATPPSASDENR